MRFNKFVIDNPWQQFSNIEIDIHPRLTVITGANGSGKSTLLNILAKHSGWDFNSLSVPWKDKSTRAWGWIISLFKAREDSNNLAIGYLEYSDKETASIQVPRQNSAQYSVQIQNQKAVDCFFIPSHRSVFRYQAIQNIPTQGIIDKMQAFQRIFNSNREHFFGGSGPSSSFHIKEILVSWSLFGRGNVDMEPARYPIC